MLRTDFLAFAAEVAVVCAEQSRCLHAVGYIDWVEKHVPKLHETSRTEEQVRMLRVDRACSEAHVASHAAFKYPIRPRWLLLRLDFFRFHLTHLAKAWL